MKGNNDFNNQSDNKLMIYFGLLMLAIIGLVLIVIVANNQTVTSSSSGFEKAKQEALSRKQDSTNEEELVISSGYKPTSDELDIWYLPPTGRTQVTNEEKQSTDNTTKPESKPVENIPTTSEIVSNLFAPSDFIKDGNIMKYMKNGTIASTMGVELSWEQGSVNMKRIKNSGCDFVMLHLGQRGYASGIIVMDDSFQKNLEDAIKAGLKVGIIFKSQARTKAEMIEESDVILTALRGYRIDYPVFIEYENLEDEITRTDGMTIEDYTDLYTYFANEVQNSGFETGIYADSSFLLEKIDLNEIPSCEIWVTQEGDFPEFEGDISFWNYNSGIFNGISNNTKFSIHFENN